MGKTTALEKETMAPLGIQASAWEDRHTTPADSIIAMAVVVSFVAADCRGGRLGVVPAAFACAVSCARTVVGLQDRTDGDPRAWHYGETVPH